MSRNRKSGSKPNPTYSAAKKFCGKFGRIPFFMAYQKFTAKKFRKKLVEWLFMCYNKNRGKGSPWIPGCVPALMITRALPIICPLPVILAMPPWGRRIVCGAAPRSSTEKSGIPEFAMLITCKQRKEREGNFCPVTAKAVQNRIRPILRRKNSAGKNGRIYFYTVH